MTFSLRYTSFGQFFKQSELNFSNKPQTFTYILERNSCSSNVKVEAFDWIESIFQEKQQEILNTLRSLKIAGTQQQITTVIKNLILEAIADESLIIDWRQQSNFSLMCFQHIICSIVHSPQKYPEYHFHSFDIEEYVVQHKQSKTSKELKEKEPSFEEYYWEMQSTYSLKQSQEICINCMENKAKKYNQKKSNQKTSYHQTQSLPISFIFQEEINEDREYCFCLSLLKTKKPNIPFKIYRSLLMDWRFCKANKVSRKILRDSQRELRRYSISQNQQIYNLTIASHTLTRKKMRILITLLANEESPYLWAKVLQFIKITYVRRGKQEIFIAINIAQPFLEIRDKIGKEGGVLSTNELVKMNKLVQLIYDQQTLNPSLNQNENEAFRCESRAQSRGISKEEGLH